MTLHVVSRDARGRTEPAYRQIAAWFRGEIDAGRLGPGDRLPTVRALANDLGVNRDTVALAYEVLAREQRIESTVGRGTFVRRPPDAELAPAFEPVLSPVVERLLDDRGRLARHEPPARTARLHSIIPDPSLYPVDDFRRALGRVLGRGGAATLGYAPPQGDPRLRELLAARLRRAGVQRSAAEVVITLGASDAIALALRLFATPGDAVAVEDPTYHNVLGALAAAGLRPAPVPMRDGAPDLAVLERTLARPDVKLLYTMPAFHNPLGTTTPHAHRRALLALAARTGTPVVEDAYELDLHHGAAADPPLAALDERGLVVMLLSFSKSLFPGVRVGALVAAGRAVEAARAVKHASDLGGAPVLQAALAEMLERGSYDRHLARVRRVLRARCAALLDALAATMPEGASWTVPAGGLQLWVRLPPHVDTAALLPEAVRAGVLYAPGAQFRSDRGPSSGLRLSFSLAGEDELRRGTAVLAGVVRDHLREHTAPPAEHEAVV